MIVARMPIGDWTRLVRPDLPAGQVMWLHRLGVLAISSVDTTESGPEWHVSVSTNRRRPTDEELALARRAFALADAEEDNHLPGGARHLWLTVNPDLRAKHCPCKAEGLIVEPDGYAWAKGKAP